MKKIFFCLIILFISSLTYSQNKVTLNDIRSKYESFDYMDVIRLTDIYLYNNNSITVEDSIEVLTMKAISQYSLNELNSAEVTFIELLKLDHLHNLDPAKISPKIISFYNEIKADFKPEIPELVEAKKDTVSKPLDIKALSELKSEIYTSTFSRSMLLPGLGHLYLENNTKGWILASVSTLTLGSMIYFIFDTNSKEKNYLNETVPDQISKKYDEYNLSYKIRNALIFGYAAVWLYSQVDLLYFSEDLFLNKIESSFKTSILDNGEVVYKLQFKIHL